MLIHNLIPSTQRVFPPSRSLSRSFSCPTCISWSSRMSVAYSEQELVMPVPAKQPPALKRQQGSPGTPTPLAFSCSADGGQFCDEAWKGIADKLELSQRQLDVCRGVVLGEQDKCIARTLGVSPRTIETHMGRVYEKLKIQNRAQLATRVVVAYHAWRMESNHPSVCPYKYGLESL